jgi:hypothetical protein
MPITHFFADESSQSGCRYMLLSGIVIDDTDLEATRKALKAVQEKHKTLGTMKWGKVSQSKLHVYRDYCDLFFKLSSSDTMHFHSVTIDTSELDHKSYNAGNAEIGFSKFIYQLLVKIARLYATENVLYVWLDRRKTKQSLNELQEIVNNGLAKHWNLTNKPVRRIVFRETEDEPILQINDVLLGALAARCNGHHAIPGASPAKAELSAYILKLGGIGNPLRDTPRGVSKFTTWKFALRRKITLRKGVRRP